LALLSRAAQPVARSALNQPQTLARAAQPVARSAQPQLAQP